jgi:hypothetical protein
MVLSVLRNSRGNEFPETICGAATVVVASKTIFFGGCTENK